MPQSLGRKRVEMHFAGAVPTHESAPGRSYPLMPIRVPIELVTNMNPTIYSGCVAEVRRMAFLPADVLGTQHSIKLTFGVGISPIRLQRVHVSGLAQQLLLRTDVEAIRVETLQTNSLASSLLGSATSIVTNVQFKDGTGQSTIPLKLRRWRTVGMASSVAIVAAMSFQLAPHLETVLAELVLLGASHSLRTFLTFPSGRVASPAR